MATTFGVNCTAAAPLGQRTVFQITFEQPVKDAVRHNPVDGAVFTEVAFLGETESLHNFFRVCIGWVYLGHDTVQLQILQRTIQNADKASCINPKPQACVRSP